MDTYKFNSSDIFKDVSFPGGFKAEHLSSIYLSFELYYSTSNIRRDFILHLILDDNQVIG